MEETVSSVAPLPLTSPFHAGQEVGYSRWLTIDQGLIDRFGEVTFDPDPMHVDPEWSRQHSPFVHTIAFGFLSTSLLTHLLHTALDIGSHRDPAVAGHYLNYGFDRLRLVAPVPVDARIRGHFMVWLVRQTDRGHWLVVFDARIDIEGDDRPALIAEWVSAWLPPQ